MKTQNSFENIAKAKQEFIKDQIHAPTHIIFPLPEDYPKNTLLTVGDKQFRIFEGKQMGEIFGMKIYVDRKAKCPYLIDASILEEEEITYKDIALMVGDEDTFNDKMKTDPYFNAVVKLLHSELNKEILSD